MSNRRTTLKEKAKTYIGQGWPTREEKNFEAYFSTREKRAAKIRTLLYETGALPSPRGILLDVGCSSGKMMQIMREDAALCVGVDLDASAGIRPSGNIVFSIADGEQLPFRDDSIDVVICNHIYEHTDDPQRLVDEIWRVLKEGGHCYFAGPNRWEPVEPHYGLLFLSWLPRPLADLYMRLTKRGDYYPERPLGLRKIRHLLRRFEIESCAERISNNPERYDSEDLLPPGSVRQRAAVWIAANIPSVFPGFIFICRKSATTNPN
ncbi:class I SAM-dependent methyltransferase [Dyella silvatica]|uniref:class I SAM-dependent methyltransferase n=1 Tax=Dyella silvatica TaxID=2992128 RepID=UPI00225B9B50|nr:class I SAM-dependent methyltransferase [Dyella silvatica]